MDIKRFVALLLSSFACVLCLAQTEPVAFVNANVITMADEAVLTNQTLVVRNGHIAAMGRDVALQGDEKVVDARGGFLMPGLAEMHAHVPPVAEARYMRDVLFLWLANGITTVRGMLGEAGHLQLRDDLLSHKVLGPRLYTSGPSFNGNSVSTPQQARQRVRQQAAAGYDFLKLHPGLSREVFDAIAAEAHRLGIDFVGHVSLDVGLLRSMAAGQRTIDHMDGFVQALVPDLSNHDQAAASFFGIDLMPHVDQSRLGPIVEAARQSGAWIVPTQTLLDNVATPVDGLTSRVQNRYLPRALLSRYEQSIARLGGNEQADDLNALRDRLLKRLFDSGVPILLGSDSPQIFNVPGFSIHRELAAMTRAGLSNFAALQAGTVNPARYFENNAGILAVGKDADIVLLDTNPLQAIGNSASIEGVMVRGRWLDRAALDAGLEEIARRAQAM